MTTPHFMSQTLFSCSLAPATFWNPPKINIKRRRRSKTKNPFQYSPPSRPTSAIPQPNTAKPSQQSPFLTSNTPKSAPRREEPFRRRSNACQDSGVHSSKPVPTGRTEKSSTAGTGSNRVRQLKTQHQAPLSYLITLIAGSRVMMP